MSLSDHLVGKAMDTVENKLDVEGENEKTTVGGGVLRFFVSLVWVLISFGASFVGAMAMVGGDFLTFFEEEKSKSFYALGLGLCLIIAATTFCVPYLRKKGTVTRYCGILAIMDFIWWTYLMITLGE